MDTTCPNCGSRVIVNPNQPVRHVTREADGDEPAVYLIMETGEAGSWLLHRCPLVEKS